MLFSPTVTSVSNTISQEGELALEDDSSVCDDIFLMGQVRENNQNLPRSVYSNQHQKKI